MHPQDNKGQFIPLACPNRNCGGFLRQDDKHTWRCNGLVDPGTTDEELQPCDFVHTNYDSYLGEE